MVFLHLNRFYFLVTIHGKPIDIVHLAFCMITVDWKALLIL